MDEEGDGSSGRRAAPFAAREASFVGTKNNPGGRCLPGVGNSVSYHPREGTSEPPRAGRLGFVVMMAAGHGEGAERAPGAAPSQGYSRARAWL